MKRQGRTLGDMTAPNPEIDDNLNSRKSNMVAAAYSCDPTAILCSQVIQITQDKQIVGWLNYSGVIKKMWI